jgi:hypothetical protein
MIGDQNRFLELKPEKYGSVSFGNDQSTNIIGIGMIRLGSNNAKAQNVLLIEDMKHNLLSVSKM